MQFLAYNTHMNPLVIALGVLVLLIAVWSLYGYFSVRGIERPSYSVVEKRAGYELRRYDQYIVAETAVTGDVRTAIEEGFRRIAGYIFGGNKTKASIAMTAPVGERPSASEKIAMTAPVVARGVQDDARVISFVMPKKYTLDTLPTPNDSRVTLRVVAPRTVAALVFSWSGSAKTTEAKKAELAALLARDAMSAAGEPEAAFYNPPWTPPFMLHSEILIPLAEK